MRSIVLLGSTGSIGESTLRVVSEFPEQIRVVGLAAFSNFHKLIDQAKRFNVKTVAIVDKASAAKAESLASPLGITVLSGEQSLEEICTHPEADTVLCSVVGLAGLKPVLSAMAAGKDVALATKEVLVSGGELVMKARAKAGCAILPVDSEHNALFQCLQSASWDVACVRPVDTPVERFAESRVSRLLLTASGGPFAFHPEVDFSLVTPEQALNHPRWNMGRKVTVDSATMMNKGLEILEASALFAIPVPQIGVLVHPQSYVHSLVEFKDGSLMAQLSQPDMRFPIQFALLGPDRFQAKMPTLDLAKVSHLEFSEPDEKRFPCLRLAREAVAAGGTMSAAMNAADEIAVNAFLDGKIAFCQIWEIIEQTMAAHDNIACDSFDAVFEADSSARRIAAALCGGDAHGLF